MQIIHIQGNLTADAQLKKVTVQGKESEFVSFSVAVNEKYNGNEETTFYDVTMQKTGIFNYLNKGQKVSIVGPFRFRKTTGKDKNGNPAEFCHLNVRVFTIELSGGPKPVEMGAVGVLDDIPSGDD